jgi:hypothetical protein
MRAETHRTPLPVHFQPGLSGLSGYFGRKPRRCWVSTIPFMDMESGLHRDRPGFVLRIGWQEVKTPESSLSARRKIRANRYLAAIPNQRREEAREAQR